ncbi:MAG: carbon-nitrogen hydrolase family protein [candidate division Zixibacteria bacterium]|nr:carbon-nitrogen hydrolase family protein [candidate division Zixibacteria bacterium]
MILIILFAVLMSGCREQKKTSTVRVAGIILKWIPGDCESNCQRAERLIRRAAAEKADIICTTESFLDGYSIRMPDFSLESFRSLAEPIPNGHYFRRLRELSDTLNIYLIAAVSEIDGDRIYNSAAVIGPDGELIGIYRKKFLWGDENNVYVPGDSFPAFETEYGKIGIIICSDRRHPEAISELVQNGAEIVFCPAGGGFGDWNDKLVGQRSIEGKVPIVFVHPAEFLVTGLSGNILQKNLVGDQVDENMDNPQEGEMHYYDLELSQNIKPY